ncbi:ATP-grasp domain-containing protein, partial [bacterium]|nr:ATP-grasp domain-containing protein [bacterium]
INLLYFLRTNFLWDLATLFFFKKNKIKYNVVIGLRNLKTIKNSRVIYNPGYDLNHWNIENDVAFFPLISEILENQSNSVIPKSKEIIYWENKSFMYKNFAKHSIDMPETYVINKSNFDNQMKKIDNKHRWLYKPNHSKSSIGIVEVKEDLKEFVQKKFLSSKDVVLQKIIDIDKDCRIIIINEEVVLQYWRNKVESDVWKPTSTSTGSKVTFQDYPKSISDWAKKSTKSLGLSSAAWDIVFVPSDKKMEFPLALEVSPIYYPNPRKNYNPKNSYASYKKSLKYEKYLLEEFGEHISKKLSKWKKL